MPKPHWFPFYPNDFLASSKVALLTTEEIGAYLLLLCHAWQDPQCSLPDDDEALSKLGRIKGDMTSLRACFTVKKYRLINERLYKEWIKANEQKELASKHGKQGAMKRWIATPLATPLGLAIQNDSSSSSSSSSSSELRKDKKMSVRTSLTLNDTWIEELKKNPAYLHINWIVEFGKMDAWFSKPANQHRKRTQTFVLNWLNKIEAPMQGGNGKPLPPPYPPKNDPIGRGQWKHAFGKPEDYGYVQ